MRMLTLMKSLELIFLTAIFIATIERTARLAVDNDSFKEIEGTRCHKDNKDPDGACLDVSVFALLYTCIIIMFFHVAHVNLLVNLRLALVRETTLCTYLWRPINCLICKFGLASERYKGL